MNLNTKIDVLHGIGPARLKILNSQNIFTLGDVLYYFPRKYLDRNFTNKVLIKEGDYITLPVQILNSYLAHGKKSRLIVTVKSERGEKINLLFFKGIPYFQKILKAGLALVISGQLEYFKGLQIIHPELEILNDTEDSNLIHTGRIIPLYPSTEQLKENGMDSKGFRKLVKQIFDLHDSKKLEIPEILPSENLKKRNLLSRNQAFEKIHFPDDQESIEESRRRFAYEELYYFSLLMEFKKQKRELVKRVLWPLQKTPTGDTLLKKLPFSLTEDQTNAISTIIKGSFSDRPVATLLQGDVGSGKTITALMIALHYTDNRIQVAMVAPTEILARQHYINIMNLLGNFPFMGIELFLGKEKEKTKKEKAERLKSGETLFAIGTHTLFQEDIEFNDLGLVIFDEQHKFGVQQRESLRSKGKNPDILAMTATPIPRTLCLTLYGDLNLVLIKSKPKNRKSITTKWITDDKRDAVYNSLKKYLKQGRQAFVIYPIIEESEKIDLESCISGYETLKTNIFQEYEVGLLHGKMKSNEKEIIMEKFKKMEIQILVTTTVVEVGIDIPNANVMLIEHSDRFGLSQLHQLRGRVGRGEWESFCILMSKEKVSPEATQRLDAMTQFEDGFALSEIDLKIRGPGELLGTRQSGLPDFKVANLQNDLILIEEAKEDSSNNKILAEIDKLEIRNRFEEGKILFSN
jgi:ATP-dependent DNA helicase RecG